MGRISPSTTRSMSLLAHIGVIRNAGQFVPWSVLTFLVVLIRCFLRRWLLIFFWSYHLCNVLRRWFVMQMGTSCSCISAIQAAPMTEEFTTRPCGHWFVLASAPSSLDFLWFQTMLSLDLTIIKPQEEFGQMKMKQRLSWETPCHLRVWAQSMCLDR